MRLIVIVIAAALSSAGFLVAQDQPAAKDSAAPKESKTIEEITKAVGGHNSFGVKTAQLSRWGRQIFAVWYCPFSGRDSCYLHAYYYDYDKARWIRFVDELVDGTHDLSVEMTTGEAAVIFRRTDGKVVQQVSVAKFPHKKK